MSKDVTIKIERYGKGWSADLLERPGSPPVGLGRTKVMALAALLYHLLDAPKGDLTVNGKPWKDVRGASKR